MPLLRNYYKNSRGFTLLELMVVIAIIGILASSLYPSMSNYFLRAKVTNNLQHLKTIRTALETYEVDQGSYPNGGMTGWENEYGCFNGNPLYNQKDQWIPGLVSGGYMTSLPNGNLGASGECDMGLFIYFSVPAEHGYKLLSHGEYTAKQIKLSKPELLDPVRDGGIIRSTIELDSSYTPWAYGYWIDVPFYRDI